MHLILYHVEFNIDLYVNVGYTHNNIANIFQFVFFNAN